MLVTDLWNLCPLVAVSERSLCAVTILEQTAYCTLLAIAHTSLGFLLGSSLLFSYLKYPPSSATVYCSALFKHWGNWPLLKWNSNPLLPPLSAIIRNISGLALAAIPNVYKTRRVSIPCETNLLHRFSPKRRGRKKEKQKKNCSESRERKQGDMKCSHLDWIAGHVSADNDESQIMREITIAHVGGGWFCLCIFEGMMWYKSYYMIRQKRIQTWQDIPTI